jgi:hypothetical protein
MPWDGISFADLLLGGIYSKAAGKQGSQSVDDDGLGSDASRRVASKQQQQQQERMLFVIGPYCWDADTVPLLDSRTRCVMHCMFSCRKCVQC